jgi:hypothetical protein
VQLEGPDGTVTISLPPESPIFPRFPNAFAGLPATALLPPRDIHRVDPGFTNPYAIQTSVGAEGRLFRRFVVGADFVHLSGRDLMSIVDVNAPESIVKPGIRTVPEADATRPLRPVPGGFRKIITLGNLGRSSYRALQVKAHRSSGEFQTTASYTLARGEDMANYLLPEDSRNIPAEEARASTDLRHSLVVGLTWDPPIQSGILKDLMVSGIGIFRSNRPFDVVWGDDRNGTTQNDARPAGRNTGTTTSFATVDLAITKRFHWNARTLEARVEAFNLLNATNYDEYVGVLLSPFYNQPVSAFPKRRFQLAAIVRF